MWASGAREEALGQLRDFNTRLTMLVNQSNSTATAAGAGGGSGHDAHGHHPTLNGINGSTFTRNGGADPLGTVDMKHLLSRCYLKQGAWQMALQDEWNEV